MTMPSPSFGTPQSNTLLARATAQGLSAEARGRAAWIAAYLERGRSVSDVCAEFGITRGTFHRWMKRFNPDDLTSLEERSHQPKSVRQSSVSAEIVEKIRGYRQAQPLLGKERIAELLRIESGVSLSSSTVARIIERECLYFGDTPLHWKKRLGETRPVEQMLALSGHADAATCACAYCRMRRWNWPRIRRSMLVASVLTNLALGALAFGTVAWERGESVRAQLLPDAVSLDAASGSTLHATSMDFPSQP